MAEKCNSGTRLQIQCAGILCYEACQNTYIDVTDILIIMLSCSNIVVG